MGVIKINPTKILFGGDVTLAKDFIGQAKSQMDILLQDLSFQKLKQGIRRIQPYNNVTIECRKVFDYQECRIYVEPKPVESSSTSEPIYFYVRLKNTTAGYESDRMICYDVVSREVLIDVDVVSGVTTLGDGNALSDVTGWISDIDSGQGYDNLFTTWFNEVSLVDPYSKRDTASDAPYSHPELSYSLNDSLAGVSGTDYWFFNNAELPLFSPNVSNYPNVTRESKNIVVHEFVEQILAPAGYKDIYRLSGQSADNYSRYTQGSGFHENGKAFPSFVIGLLAGENSFGKSAYRLEPGALTASGGCSSAVSSLITPLEILFSDEYKDSTYDDCPCSELSCWCKYCNGYDSGGYTKISDYTGAYWEPFPCNLAETSPLASPFNYAISNELGGDWFNSDCNIPDRSDGENYFSITIDSGKTSSRNGGRYRNDYIGGAYRKLKKCNDKLYNTEGWLQNYPTATMYSPEPPSGSPIGEFYVDIDGERTTYSVYRASEAPTTYGFSIGIVIYIFNPDNFWWEDAWGNTEFWDIHNEIQDPSLINTNRAIDLEEYVNAILVDIMLEHRVPDAAYKTLADTGTVITTGFINEET